MRFGPRKVLAATQMKFFVSLDPSGSVSVQLAPLDYVER